MLDIGDKAPEFSLPDKDGNMRSLSEFIGKTVILYFYSKDMTAGCTKQACGFAELYPEFTAKDAVIIGVSKDSVASHKKFADKYNLPFILLSDPERTVIESYGVWKEKVMYGKSTMGVVRTTFIIDKNGVVSRIFQKAKAADNPAETLQALSE